MFAVSHDTGIGGPQSEDVIPDRSLATLAELACSVRSAQRIPSIITGADASSLTFEHSKLTTMIQVWMRAVPML